MAEIIVTSTADSGSGSLRQAIADASDGDVILFDADVFPQGQTTSILLSSHITVNKSVSIYGGESDGAGDYTSGATKRFYVYRDVEGVRTKVVIASPDDAQEGETVLFENICRIALDGQNAARCVWLNSTTDANCVFSGVCFKNGSTTSAGGVYISNTNSNTFADCAIESCVATGYGGGLFTTNEGQNTLNDCTISDCSAANGGGVYSASSSKNTLNDCSITGCSANYGGGVYSRDTSQNTLTDCNITGCNAMSNGGGVYSANTSQNTLNGCNITNCTATNGGGVYLAYSSQNTLNDCTITGCSATNGGGLRSADTSNNVVSDCIFDSCSATNGGAVYSLSESQNTLNGCNITNCSATSSGGGVYSGSTSQNTLNDCNFDVSSTVYVVNTSALIISGGITTIAAATLGTATITINDGAALTITDTATIGAATFTSDGRGYLAVGARIDVSAATLTNVVLCAYGADVSSFAEVDGVLEWSAANPTTTVLIERADGDSWSTVAQPTGESLTLYLPPSDTVRLFDGVQFFTATAPSQRTYYYIGGAEGSFTSAADWSLRRGGTAITEPPVVAGQRFIVGDIEDAQEE